MEADQKALAAASSDDDRAGYTVDLERRDRPMLAEAEARAGDVAGARTLIESAPADCYDCARVRGVVAALSQDHADADRWFAAAARQAPSLPFAYVDWGAALLARGDLRAAIAKLELAHGKGPHFADPLELWGEALMRQGDYAGAAAKFAEAVRYAPHWDRNNQLLRQAQAKAGHG
jgi:predicted Zn-dependent protease